MYNCKWCGAILAAAILVVTIWPNLIGATASMWVVIVAAVLLLLHGLGCPTCKAPEKDKAKKKK